MNRNNDGILSSQLAAILSITVVGVGILTLPKDVTEKAGPDGWMLVLAGSFFALLAGLIMYMVVKKYPGKTFVQLSSTILGKPLGLLLSAVFFVYLTILTAYEVRAFGEITKQYLLFNTPLEVLIFTMLLGTAYTARSGIEPIARLSEILFPIVTLTAILIVLPIIPEIDLTHFLPVFRTPVSQLIKGVPTVFFSFIGIELILVFAAFVDRPQRINQSVFLSIGLITFFYISIVVITVARFGLIETTHIIWPVLEIFKTVQFPGAFVENIEAFIMFIWIISIYMTTAVVYYGASLLFSEVIGAKEYNYFVLPLLPIVYFIALVPDNVAQLQDWMGLYANYGGTFFMAVVPLLMLFLSLLRKNKEAKKSG